MNLKQWILSHDHCGQICGQINFSESIYNSSLEPFVVNVVTFYVCVI
nr:MAG TPA: hypothetical protein [Caudoviricetes sp.]